MKQLIFSHPPPLQQDETGTVRVTGSRITLDTLVAEFKRGATAEQIQDSFPSLSLGQIYGTISYYLDCEEDVEGYLAERRAEAQALREEVESQPGYQDLRNRIRQRSELTRA